MPSSISSVQAMSKVHLLKTWPEYYAAVDHPDPQQRKSVELRQDDRGFEVGDIIALLEYDPERQEYTGRRVYRLITHCLRGGPWLSEGYVALSIKEIDKND